MTPQQYQDWLESDTALRCVLIEAVGKYNGYETMFYFSNRGYNTKPTDGAYANIEYASIVTGGVSLTEQISVGGSSSPMSYGLIELDNNDRENSFLADVIWMNRNINIYFGDEMWPRADFQLVISGVMGSLKPNGRNRFNLSLLDKLQRLNTPVSELLVGGNGDNKELLQMSLLGEAFNFEPILIDPANHRYQFSTVSSERVIEVRDDAVPVSVNTTLGAGYFELLSQPKGQITMSAQGDNVGGYSNTIVGLIKKLAMSYGKPELRFTGYDLDNANLNAFDLAHPDPVGLPIKDRPTVLETCHRLAGSLGAMVAVSRVGLLQVLRADFPVTDVPVDIVIDDMVGQTLKHVDTLPVSASVTLGYRQNHTVQASIDNGVPEQHRELFKQPWAVVNREDLVVAADYRLHTTPEQEDTLLLDADSAASETDRRLGVRKVERKTYEFDGFAPSLNLKLGQAVRITYPDFGMQAGKLGRIVRLNPDYLKARCNVQVMF